ncbi:MAG TPA: hypothetical protein VK157_07340 [Phycisphaerales bacterium]|nr:hypothetical protein [Phycisphaerales bacterium]
MQEPQPSRKTIRRPLAIAAVVVVCLLILAIVPNGIISARMRADARERILTNLTSVSAGSKPTPERLGIDIDLPDGTWIVIDYRDSHSYPGYSLAYALTSDGTWYTSREHFCGRWGSMSEKLKQMKQYRDSNDELEREMSAYAEQSLKNDPQARIVFANTLTEAKAELIAIGFEQVQPPTSAK